MVSKCLFSGILMETWRQSKEFSYGNSISSAMMTGMHPTISAWYALNVHGDQPRGQRQNVEARISSR